MHVVGAADDSALQRYFEHERVAAVVSKMERLQLHHSWCGKEAAERLRVSMDVSTSDVELYRANGGEPMTGMPACATLIACSCRPTLHLPCIPSLSSSSPLHLHPSPNPCQPQNIVSVLCFSRGKHRKAVGKHRKAVGKHRKEV